MKYLPKKIIRIRIKEGEKERREKVYFERSALAHEQKRRLFSSSALDSLCSSQLVGEANEMYAVCALPPVC